MSEKLFRLKQIILFRYEWQCPNCSFYNEEELSEETSEEILCVYCGTEYESDQYEIDVIN